ncbi:protein serine/threonine kinase [Pelomyxa schiedti]|nr:protein serine/threonine kinase [Pelomyxa schiedti]
MPHGSGHHHKHQHHTHEHGSSATTSSSSSSSRSRAQRLPRAGSTRHLPPLGDDAQPPMLLSLSAEQAVLPPPLPDDPSPELDDGATASASSTVGAGAVPNLALSTSIEEKPGGDQCNSTAAAASTTTATSRTGSGTGTETNCGNGATEGGGDTGAGSRILSRTVSVSVAAEDIDDVFSDPEQEFQMIEKLGEGSYGAVWKAKHRQTHEFVAIKVLQLDTDLGDIKKEIDFMKTCKHPNIISYFGSYFKDCDLWIVMEYCSVGSCSDLMQICKKTLNEDQIGYVAYQVLQGLAYLHSVRLLHRDIKAGNILINDRGECKLADFGVSGRLSDTMSRMHTVIGTPFWMAPEVINGTGGGAGYTTKVDVWSLGITVLEMAEGAPPLHDLHPMRAIFLIPTLPPPKFQDTASKSPEIVAFLALCLKMNAAERPSAKELLSDPFIQRCCSKTQCLAPLIQEQTDLLSKQSRNNLLGLDEETKTKSANEMKPKKKSHNKENEEAGESDTMIEKTTSTTRFDSGTVVAPDSDLEDSGTMVIRKEDEEEKVDGKASLEEMLGMLKDADEECSTVKISTPPVSEQVPKSPAVDTENETVKLQSKQKRLQSRLDKLEREMTEAISLLEQEKVKLKQLQECHTPRPLTPLQIRANLPPPPLHPAPQPDSEVTQKSFTELRHKHFWATAYAAKLRLIQDNTPSNVLISDLWKSANYEQVPFEEWKDWIPQQLQSKTTSLSQTTGNALSSSSLSHSTPLSSS